jgi:hypothetical protein
MNPDLVPDLFSTYSPSNLRIVENVEGIDRKANALRLTPRKGVRVFGGVAYQSHESEFIGANGKPNAGTYVYEPQSEEDPIPPHWITCVGWGRVDDVRTLTCNVWVDDGSVVGSLLFIGSKMRGFEFVDHFPLFAQDIARILAVANVTDRLDELEGLVDIVD